jgi:hypothetical protein
MSQPNVNTNHSNRAGGKRTTPGERRLRYVRVCEICGREASQAHLWTFRLGGLLQTLCTEHARAAGRIA